MNFLNKVKTFLAGENEFIPYVGLYNATGAIDATNPQHTQTLSPVEDAVVLVTAEDLTSSYADLGSEIEKEGYTKIGIWVKADVNDSENVTMKVVGLYETGGDEYEIDGISVKTLWSTGATDFNKYYEFETGAIPIVKIQAVAGTVGSTAGTLTINITKVN